MFYIPSIFKNQTKPIAPLEMPEKLEIHSTFTKGRILLIQVQFVCPTARPHKNYKQQILNNIVKNQEPCERKRHCPAFLIDFQLNSNSNSN